MHENIPPIRAAKFFFCVLLLTGSRRSGFFVFPDATHDLVLEADFYDFGTNTDQNVVVSLNGEDTHDNVAFGLKGAYSYVARVGVTATFMWACEVPVSLQNVLLILAGNAIASTFAFTPGGVGTQQALATTALRNSASSSVVAAYSLGQQLILAAWDVGLGLLLLWSSIGWTATRALVHRDTPTPLTTRPTVSQPLGTRASL